VQSLPKQINRLIGRAMHDYGMLEDGDRVLVAVSGGVDSLVLSWILDHWQHKAPITYKITAVHLDMGFEENAFLEVEAQLQKLAIDFFVEKTDFGQKALLAEGGKSVCYHCSQKRRNRLFDIARTKNFSKIAFGHHKEDIIETFFLNMLYSGNLSTMVPRQDLFGGQLALIRPLAYLTKDQIKEIADLLSLKPVANPCPIEKDSKREHVRTILDSLYRSDPKIKANIFSSLANIKEDYLLSPTRKTKNANNP
jgi:tRNA 2-thiocytidine biosynthesis protein TtcA